MLRKLKDGESVKVGVRAADEALIIELPRREFRMEAKEPIEVKVYFGDLREALSIFEAAGFAPLTLGFHESVLALETEYGGLRLRALWRASWNDCRDRVAP